MSARLKCLAEYKRGVEQWRQDHADARALYRLEDAYRFFLATLRAALDAERVLAEREPSPEDAAAERAELLRVAEALTLAFDALEETCQRSGAFSYGEPRVLEPDEIKRARRQARNLCAWITDLEGVKPDPEAHRAVEAELRAAWGE